MTLFTPKGFTSLNLYKCHQLGWMGFCLYNETALYKGHSYVKGVVKDLLHGKHPILEKFEGGNEKGALIVTTLCFERESQNIQRFREIRLMQI